METENPSPTGRNARVASPNQEQLSRTPSLRKILQTELNAVKDTSFLVDKDNMLGKAIEGHVHDILLKSCPKCNGLPLRNSPLKKTLKPNRLQFHQVFHKTLPRRRKWKRKISAPKVLIGEEGDVEDKKEVQYMLLCFNSEQFSHTYLKESNFKICSSKVSQ